ncbi:hypothetical protein ACF0H5_011688 [Mactra antiquata]
MAVLTVILGVALFNIMVTGLPVDYECAFVRCYASVDCTRALYNRCCSECRQAGVCIFKGNEYKDGQPMPSSRHCWLCYCQSGTIQCSPPICPACVGTPRPGQCCPDCSSTDLS